MSLTRRLSQLVEQRTRSRGAAYFQQGRVRLVESSDQKVRAVVRGSVPYEVSLGLRGSDLVVRCSCPQYERTAWVCKHVWAALLAAEARGHLTGKPGAPRVETIGVPDDLEADQEVWDTDDDALDDVDDAGWTEATPQHSRLLPATRPRRAPPLPGWKDLVSGLNEALRAEQARHREPWVPGREILYLIDAQRTLAESRIALDILTRSRKQNGAWSKLAAAKIAVEQLPDLPDADDREILSLLRGASDGRYDWYPSPAYGVLPQSVGLASPLSDIVLPRICRTGRCLLRPPGEDAPPGPLVWDDGPPWELWIDVCPDGSGKRYGVAGNLRRGDERMELSRPVLFFAGGFVFTRERAARLADFGAFPWIGLLREHPLITVPVEHGAALLDELLRSPHLPRLDLPPELEFEETRVAPRPRLVLRSPVKREWAPERLVAELSFDYEGVIVQEEDSSGGVFDPRRRCRILRDPEAEGAAAARLVALGFRHSRSYYDEAVSRQLTPRHLPRVVQALLADGWHVEAEGKLYRTPGALRMNVTSGIDWFELEGSVAYGDQVATLPELLAATKRGETLVRLGDGTFGLLPEEWLAKFGPLAGFGAPDGDHLRFGRSQIAVLDALLAAEPEASCDEAFAAARNELARFTGIEPADPAPAFVGELRPYQREGLGWIHFLERFRFGGCLADDMGLGKTVQVLAFLDLRRHRRTAGEADVPHPSLVVAPRSLIFNWKAEAQRFTPVLRVLDHTGSGRDRGNGRFDDYDLVLTTYGTLRRDAPHLKDVRFGWVILDEAQAIKNAASASAKAARLLRADQRLALSGTPIENHLGELWSLFEFLNPGMLGAASAFRAFTGAGVPDEGGRALLARALRPFLLRRRKEQVARELPPRTEQTIVTELARAQRRLYDELRDHYRRALRQRIERDGFARARMHVLEALLRLRQAACHAGLVDRSKRAEPSAKLEALLPTLEEVVAEGHKALVFSQFTSFLAIVRDRLDHARVPYEYLDGRTRDRAGRVERFQNDPGCRLFLISLKAGGLGLNLTAAEYVFLLDPWWNPAVEAQAVDRTHRIGQTRQVFAYRLIARDTVEEKVLELQQSKRALADALFTNDNSLIRTLSREDLELLLS